MSALQARIFSFSISVRPQSLEGYAGTLRCPFNPREFGDRSFLGISAISMTTLFIPYSFLDPQMGLLKSPIHIHGAMLTQ
jgi:hypothetical protein